MLDTNIFFFSNNVFKSLLLRFIYLGLSSKSVVVATFLSGVFSPLTSAEACGKSSLWPWKEKLCYYWCEKARKHMCVTDHHDMTLAVNLFPNKPWFLRVCSRKLLKSLWEKEKFLVMSNFSISHSVFYPFGEFSAIFIKCKIVVCTLSVSKSLKFVVWERVKVALNPNTTNQPTSKSVSSVAYKCIRSA